MIKVNSNSILKDKRGTVDNSSMLENSKKIKFKEFEEIKIDEIKFEQS